MNKRLRWVSAGTLLLLAVAILAAAGCQQDDGSETASVGDVQPALAAVAPSPSALDLVGQAAPAFSATAIDGSELNLEDYLGKQVVLLALWTPTCPSCQQAIPELVDLLKELDGGEAGATEPEAVEGDAAPEGAGSEQPAAEGDTGSAATESVEADGAEAEGEAAPELADFAFLTVYLGEDTEAPAQYLEANGFEFPVVTDQGATLKELYRVGMTPQLVLIGADGSVQGVYQGWASAHGATIADHLRRVRAGEDITSEAAAVPVGGG